MPIKRLLDETFFDSWTPSSAYLLGLLVADGTLTTNPRGSKYVEFVSTDIALVKLFRSSLKSNHKISVKKRPSSAPTTWSPLYRIQIGNQWLVSRLSNIGLSKKSVVPRLPQKYYREFVRGFFDGDGCVVFSSFFHKKRNRREPYFQVVLTSKYRQFLDQLYRGLRKQAGLEGGSLYKGGRAYRLRYNRNDSKKLFPFLYKNVEKGLLLTRKYKIFKRGAGYFGILER